MRHTICAMCTLRAMRALPIAAILALLLASPHPRAACARPSDLTEEDREDFAWFDGIGLPSCARKPYVRVRWVRQGAKPPLRAADVWTVDGFVVAKREETMTVLDGDLWPRKIQHPPARGWEGGVDDLDLQHVARLVTGRLDAMRSEPGAVEAMDEIYPGIRLRFGDEAQSLAFARHCAENGLEQEAHAILEAARALPPGPDVPEGATFRQVVADQLAPGVSWRILFDFSDPDIPRAVLLERFRGWARSFPDGPYRSRAEDALRVLPAMVAEDASHKTIDDDGLSRLSPADRAQELVWRLRDQTGDVMRTRGGEVSIELGKADTPAQRLVALGRDGAPALVDAVADERYTRAVLFLRDSSPRRLVVARVGDVARVILEKLADRSFWDVPEDEPSMFQHGAAERVQGRCRRWLEATEPSAQDEEGAPR